MTKEEADVRNKLRAIFVGIKDMAGEEDKPCELCPWLEFICYGFGNLPPCLWSDIEVEELINKVANRVKIEGD